MHLHRYRIIKETNSAIIEVCEQCKRKLITKKGKHGSIDNIKYLKEHRRDFLQPTNKMFKKEWGTTDFEVVK